MTHGQVPLGVGQPSNECVPWVIQMSATSHYHPQINRGWCQWHHVLAVIISETWNRAFKYSIVFSQTIPMNGNPKSFI